MRMTISHKIVGWAVGPTLETVYPLNALKMALATIDDVTASRLIHHSDRGCQYCSNEYVSELKKRHRGTCQRHIESRVAVQDENNDKG